MAYADTALTEAIGRIVHQHWGIEFDTAAVRLVGGEESTPVRRHYRSSLISRIAWRMTTFSRLSYASPGADAS